MIFKAEKIDMVSIKGETFPSVDGIIELDLSPETAATYGMVPATAEEAAAYQKAAATSKGGKGGKGSKDGSDDGGK